MSNHPGFFGRKYTHSVREIEYQPSENSRSDVRGMQLNHSPRSKSSSDSVQYLGGSRQMGPPPSFQTDFPTPARPIEMEINSSRTLPSPSVSGIPFWESFPASSFGMPDYSSGRPILLDPQVRTNAPDPLQQWYTGNDGPWIPSGISSVPEDRPQGRRSGSRIPMPHGNPYRQLISSEAGSLHYGVAPSDSGYGTLGTRHSDGNASVFSADINERDQDSQSLIGHIPDFQFPGLPDVMMQQRDSRPTEHWSPGPSSTPSHASILMCQTCQTPVKTRSELKKHDLRHTKPFLCSYPGCTRIGGFSTSNDLERHTKSKHPSVMGQSASTKRFRCHVQGCKSKDKSWPRLDNFRSHLKRVHAGFSQNEDNFEDMVRRAEFLDPPRSVMDHESHSQRIPLSNVSQALRPAQNISTLDKTLDPNRKPNYPEVLDPSHDLVIPIDPTLEEQGHPSMPGSSTSALTVRHRETVQSQDVIRPLVAPIAKMRSNPSSLGNVLAPVGVTESATTAAERINPPTAVLSKVTAKAPTAKHKDESVADATLAKAIVAALAKTSASQEFKDGSLKQDLRPRNLPHGQSSGSSRNDPHPLQSSTDDSKSLTYHTSDSAAPEDSVSLDQLKAREVLKTLHDLGYIIQKDPSHSPKPQNPGSAASNKSDNIVTCQTCKRFKGRPCELKKHMKRHERPYGCTFLTCSKTFGSKNDWKRHENSQHFHLETWRCGEQKIEGGICAKVCYRRQSFQDHLKKEHLLPENEDLKTKVDACRIGRNCQARFWCGFCTKLVDLNKKGVEAWTERFDHIDDHFMGRRGLNKQGINDWIPVNSDKPKGDLDLESFADGSQDISSSGSSPESSAPTRESQAQAKSVEESQDTLKRRRSSSDDDDGRVSKHHKSARRSDMIIYCCQCHAPGNAKLDQQCNVCESSHKFCDNCELERRPAGQDGS